MLILLLLGIGAIALASRGGAAEAAPAAPPPGAPGSLRISRDAFDHLLAVFGGGARDDLISNPKALATFKAITLRVANRAREGVFPAINFGETMGLYKIARLPGPQRDSALGKGGMRAVEVLESFAKLILGEKTPIVDPATAQKLKTLLLRVAKRWDTKTAPALTPGDLQAYYKLVLSAKK